MCELWTSRLLLRHCSVFAMLSTLSLMSILCYWTVIGWGLNSLYALYSNLQLEIFSFCIIASIYCVICGVRENVCNDSTKRIGLNSGKNMNITPRLEMPHYASSLSREIWKKNAKIHTVKRTYSFTGHFTQPLITQLSEVSTGKSRHQHETSCSEVPTQETNYMNSFWRIED